MPKPTLLFKSALLPVLLVSAMLWGCATSPRPHPPTLSLLELKVVEAEPERQEYLLRIRLQNHNPGHLPVRGLCLSLAVNGQECASVESAQGLWLAKFSDRIIEARISGQQYRIYQEAFESQEGQEGLSFHLTGRLNLTDSSTVPIDHSGRLNPSQAQGIWLTGLHDCPNCFQTSEG